MTLIISPSYSTHHSSLACVRMSNMSNMSCFTFAVLDGQPTMTCFQLLNVPVTVASHIFCIVMHAGMSVTVSVASTLNCMWDIYSYYSLHGSVLTVSQLCPCLVLVCIVCISFINVFWAGSAAMSVIASLHISYILILGSLCSVVVSLVKQ